MTKLKKIYLLPNWRLHVVTLMRVPDKEGKVLRRRAR